VRTQRLLFGVLSVIVVAAALFAAGASGRTPLPPKPLGSGTEPTAGGGVFGGKPFRARFAFAQYDSAGADLYLYLFPRRVAACRPVAYDDAPYVWVIVHTEGSRLRVGTPSASNGRDIVQVNFTFKDHYVSVTPGVTLVFTRVDPARNSLWHGRLTVKKLTYNGLPYSYAGTFAARWCGKP
jgi:hypothetical protein